MYTHPERSYVAGDALQLAAHPISGCRGFGTGLTPTDKCRSTTPKGVTGSEPRNVGRETALVKLSILVRQD